MRPMHVTDPMLGVVDPEGPDIGPIDVRLYQSVAVQGGQSRFVLGPQVSVPITMTAPRYATLDNARGLYLEGSTQTVPVTPTDYRE